MKSQLTLVAVTTLGLLAASGSSGATQQLALRVTPHVSNAPSTVIIKATIPRSSGNRSLYIEADSGAFYRSSKVQLDGDNAPVVTEIRLKNLPGGEYTVMAVLRNNQGDETVVRRSVVVLSRFGEP